MWRSSLLLLLACGPKSAVVESAAGAGPVDIEAACPTTPPTGYRVERGEGRGASAADALAAAREAATQRLVMGACAGLADSRCDALRRQVKPWKEGHFDPSDGSACASVAVEKSAFDALEREKAALDAEVAAFAGRVAALGTAVDLRPVRWHTGCPTGLAGARLLALVRNALTEAGAGAAGAEPLWLELTPGAEAVTLTATTAAGAVTGFAFAPDLLGFAADETGSCRSDGELGLAHGERPGAGGLRVSVRLPSEDGVLCEGASTAPRLEVSRPARVQLYTVSRDGRSLLVWPPPGGEDRVDAVLELDPLTAVAQADGSDERLVAIAVAEDFGLTAGWQGFCEVPGGLSPAHYPEGAAVGSASLRVLLAGSGACPEVDGIAEKRAALFSPPSCDPEAP